jgi:ATP phosphoribosyltransferase
VAQAWDGRVPAGARSESPSQDGAPRRLTIAIPAKGRLREPAVELLHDAGLGPEQPGERALAFPCRNAPVDVLLVRAADIPEYVQDGVVDCGITGADLVGESGVTVETLLELGFGACTLEAAVPTESPAQRLADLAGTRVATVYPGLTERLLGELGVDVELVRVTGAVEVAPRLGLADAIVDLVSSGRTLKANRLVAVEEIMPVSARLIVNEAALKTRRALLQPIIDAFAEAAGR